MPPLPPGAGSISMGDALTILQQLTTENVTIFEPMARTVLYSWMLILFVLFGLRMAFEGVTYWEVVKLVLKFSIAVGMVKPDGGRQDPPPDGPRKGDRKDK